MHDATITLVISTSTNGDLHYLTSDLKASCFKELKDYFTNLELKQLFITQTVWLIFVGLNINNRSSMVSILF